MSDLFSVQCMQRGSFWDISFLWKFPPSSALSPFVTGKVWKLSRLSWHIAFALCITFRDGVTSVSLSFICLHFLSFFSHSSLILLSFFSHSSLILLSFFSHSSLILLSFFSHSLSRCLSLSVSVCLSVSLSTVSLYQFLTFSLFSFFASLSLSPPPMDGCWCTCPAEDPHQPHPFRFSASNLSE
jgi:hypothetical protein